MKTSEGDRFRAEQEVEVGPTIRKELDELFETDGTYALVREQAAADFKMELHQEVRDDYRAKVDAELREPEKKAQILRQMVEDMTDSGEAAGIRAQVISLLQSEWRGEAEQSLREQIHTEEVGGKEEYVEQFREQNLASRQMRSYIEEVRARLQKEWSVATLETLNAEVDEEEWRIVIAERIAQIAKEVEDQKQKLSAEQLLEAFTGKGIDTTKIPEGARVTITLGETAVFKRTRQVRSHSGYSNTEEYEADGLFCDRSLRLTSLGDGRFIVNSDSLDGSSSPYERDHALPKDIVIVIGRVLKENGAQKFVRTVAADTRLYYDDDTTTEAVIDSKLAVANIEISGTAARQVEVVEHRHGSNASAK